MRIILGLMAFAVLLGCSGNEEDENQEDSILGDSDGQEAVVERVQEENKVLTDLTTITELPDELAYDGNLVDAYTWEDENGVNYFIRSLEEPEMDYPTAHDYSDFYDQYLHAYHYISAAESEAYVLSRELTDFVKDCEFDIILRHLDAIELNDVDGDNIGEITFGYYLACTSDVSPSSFKVFTFENGDKYGLRGITVSLGEGGDYEKGVNFEVAPEGFLEIAETYWEENKIEHAYTADE